MTCVKLRCVCVKTVQYNYDEIIWTRRRAREMYQASVVRYVGYASSPARPNVKTKGQDQS